MTTTPSPCSGLQRVARLEDLAERDKDHDCDGFGPHRICVKVEGVAQLPTRFGRFQVVAFWNNRDGKDHLALVHGDVMGASDVPTRLHSECLTGDALGSLRCDCRDQLEVALRRLSSMKGSGPWRCRRCPRLRLTLPRRSRSATSCPPTAGRSWPGAGAAGTCGCA